MPTIINNNYLQRNTTININLKLKNFTLKSEDRRFCVWVEENNLQLYDSTKEVQITEENTGFDLNVQDQIQWS